ncbi:CHAT domain-containing protein [Kocuria arenosa]|uniref:CHAT domain-containing protein n=1 Tax=Kocuria arenosa TaxID=3071446 RepID=UPI0034D3C766
MPLINELLHRVAQSQIGVYGASSGVEALQRWDQSIDVRAWRSWAEAEGAFANGRFHEAIQWMHSAEALVAETKNPVLAGELDLLWSRALNDADEPRRALPHAEAAWSCWFGLARNALQALEAGRLPALLEALSYPEKPTVSENQLFIEWLEDRASPNLHHAAKQVFISCERLQDGTPALAVAEDMRSWFQSISHAAGWSPAAIAPLVTSIMIDVANLHDALGQPQVALETFVKARALLTSSGVRADPTQTRSLDFNIANQKAKLNHHAEAISSFEQLAAAFAEAGQEEPALRARHAALVSRWHLGEDAGALLVPLEDLLRQYERLINHGGGTQASTVTQNLRRGNALWISLASRALGNAVTAERFLHLLFANREGNTQFHTRWPRANDQGETPEVIDQISVLIARLAGELVQESDNLLVFSLEMGVDEVEAVTLVAGDQPLLERLVVEPLDQACLQAAENLIIRRREVTMEIAAGAVPATIPADAGFEGACTRLWQALPAQTRKRLATATAVYFLPDPSTSLDEIPIELLLTEQGYLGIHKRVLRAASWRQLGRTWAPNRVDREPTGRFAVVRGPDSPELGKLVRADTEVEKVETEARKSFPHVLRVAEPSSDAFLALLDDGLDVLHFTGHSYADNAGEQLILSETDDVGVPELAALRAHAAPVSIFCSCLVGLHRGQARGIASALLHAGAPAVVAATVPLPDQIGLDFAVALHFHAQSRPLGEAMQAARVTLARRFHPATWGCFAMFGHHHARLVPLAVQPVPDWPALLIRCIATRGTAWRQTLQTSLQQIYGSGPMVSQVMGLADLYPVAAPGTSNPQFDEALLISLHADARLATQATLDLVAALCTSRADEARDLVGRALTIQEITDDHYLLIAVVDTGIRRGLFEVQDAVGTALVEKAYNILGWLNRSAAGLSIPKKEIETLRDSWESNLTLNLQEISGVSPDIYRAADAGDRDAMKEMLWNLTARQSTFEALSSTEPWTYWLYRLIGAGSEAAMADVMGVVDAAARSTRLSENQAVALRTLLKRFVGPGEIEPKHVRAALKAFSGHSSETKAIKLFQLYDRITSQVHKVTMSDLMKGQSLAKQVGASGAVAFLTLQLADHALKTGKATLARRQAEDALQTYSELANDDSAYESKRNLAAAFLYNVAQASGDTSLIEKVLRTHGDEIRAYFDAQ